MKAVIITNRLEVHDEIYAALGTLSVEVEILTPTLLGHPYLLTWCHKAIFRHYQENCIDQFSHYLYLEDDILISEENIIYWLESRERLRSHGLVPAFLRYEIGENSLIRNCTDFQYRVDSAKVAKILFPSINYAFISLPNPYQACYLFDNELLQEHFATIDSYGLDASPSWCYTREKAALGVTFHNVPYGFHSRTIIGYSIDSKTVDPHCLIHHTPNNYANDQSTKLGKIGVDDLIFPPVRIPVGGSKRYQKSDGSIYSFPKASMSALVRRALTLLGSQG